VPRLLSKGPCSGMLCSAAVPQLQDLGSARPIPYYPQVPVSTSPAYHPQGQNPSGCTFCGTTLRKKSAMDLGRLNNEARDPVPLLLREVSEEIAGLRTRPGLPSLERSERGGPGLCVGS